MSLNVEVVVSEASVSSNKVSNHCLLDLDSVREYLVDQELLIKNLLILKMSSCKSSKNSSTPSKQSMMLLKLQEEELEPQADAANLSLRLNLVFSNWR